MKYRHIQLQKKTYLNYYVIFKSNMPEEKYLPICDPSKLQSNPDVHLFDAELKNVLKAFWYCLYLPRTGLDLKDLNLETIKRGLYVPHSILPIPSYDVSNFASSDYVLEFPPTLVLCEDECYDEAKQFVAISGAKLGIAKISSISSEMLNNHWREIGDMMKDVKGEPRIPAEELSLLTHNKRYALTLYFLMNQSGIGDSLLSYIKNNNFKFMQWLKAGLNLYAKLNVLLEVSNYRLKERKNIELKFKEIEKKVLESVCIPLTITMAGTSSHNSFNNTRKKEIPELEREVINLIGTHRAISRNGILFDAGVIPAELFDELYKLENNCKINRNNRFIWKSLRSIGEKLSKHLGEEGINAIIRSSHITACTDFPIGLAILPNMDSPLCCIKPISYRPLTPLTRALQLELGRIPEHYIGKKCKVILAECLSKDDDLRPASDHAWSVLNEMCKKSNNSMQLVYSDIKSVEELKTFLNNNKDADILLISAHGSYDIKHNFAGLSIGKELWLASDDDISVPPVVLLSACHVSPRGSSVVSVGDLLLRVGAIVVLGTFIPVLVQRNAVLMVRLFTCILESQKGSKQFRTLADAWIWIVASNAVNEILASSDKLLKWATHVKSDGMYPLKEFQLVKSCGCLRYSHIYLDTIDILKEMAARDGIGDYFNSVISSSGYFPESVFYQMIGSPENIILYEPIFDNVY